MMGLIKRIATMRYPERNFHLDGFTILWCLSIEHAAIGDILLSTLAAEFSLRIPVIAPLLVTTSLPLLPFTFSSPRLLPTEYTAATLNWS